MSYVVVPYEHGDGGELVEANPARSRIINRGEIYIDPESDTFIDIVNMPEGRISLVGTSGTTPAVGPRQDGVTPQFSTNKPYRLLTAPPERTQVARYYCLSCQAKFFTQERLDMHVKDYPFYCPDCKSCRKQRGTETYCCNNYWVLGKGGAVTDDDVKKDGE